MSDLKKQIAKLSPEKRELLIQRLKAQSGGAAHNQIPRQSRASHQFPLSFAQERVWFVEQMEPGSVIHNFPFAFQIDGELDVDALRQTLNEIVRRHETLRTSFVTVDGKPMQLVSEDVRLSMPVVDLEDVSDDDLGEKLSELSNAEVLKPFDISRGPLIRVTLFRRDEKTHALLLCLHHIITDTVSISVFLNEFVRIYEAFSEGAPSPLGDLSVQYADYAVWQRARLQGETVEKEIRYWKEKLAGAPLILNLPTDRPRPAVQTFSGALETFSLPRNLSAEVKSFARTAGATLFMTVLAAFKALLFRYTGQDKICVGTPIANRDRTETRDLIGLFLNNLVLCTDIAGDPSFTELLRRVRTTTLAAFEHQDMPFAKLVEELQPERALSTSPLFQVMFNQLSAPTHEIELSKIKLRPPAFHESGVSKYDLTFYLDEWDGRLTCTFEYNTDLFDRDTMRRMGAHLQNVLEQVSVNPDKRLSELSLLTAAENRRLASRNATEKAYPRDRCFYQLFEEQARKNPDAVAVEFSGEQVTYSQLNCLANRVAMRLRQTGVGPNVTVGLCAERSVSMLAGLLGVHKAGGAYVPLDPAYPRLRLSYMLEDSGAPVLLTQESLLSTLPDFAGTVVTLDFLTESSTEGEDGFPWATPHPEDLAYIIYTSGTTGKPKGVAIPHRALVNFLTSMREAPGIDPDDTLLAVTTLSFDIAGLELFLPLIVGATVAIAGREETSDGRRLSDLLHQTGATIMQATPATWRLLLDSGWSNRGKLKMLCGGEALPRALANRLLSAGGELWNMYGPTESTIWSSVGRVSANEGPVYIGGPIANTQIHILDSNLQPVPAGVQGEVFIGGEGLAVGYFNRPELTAEKFIPSPLHNGPDARLYRTGDLARSTASGDLEILGRIDHQVKLRGFRIELGEIETWLSQSPGVSSAVAVVREDAKIGKRIVAYIVASDEQAPSPDDLRRFLKTALPDYMAPGNFVFLPEFPLTPSGKVDRNALPSPDSSRPELRTGYVAPRNETERKIAEIWLEILGLDKIGVDDNFFDLGGHSLLLVQAQSKLSHAFARDVSILDLFKYPSAKSLAAFLTSGGDETHDYNKLAALASRQKRAQARQQTLMQSVKGNTDE